MKTRNIERHVKNKVEEWLESIEDKELREDLRKGVMVTGGAIASLLLGEKVNDYDVYLRTRELAIKVSEYYSDRWDRAVIKRPGYEAEVGAVRSVVEAERVMMGIYLKSAIDALDAGDIDHPRNYGACEVVWEDEPEPYEPLFFTENAITLSGQIQIIIRFYGEPSEVHKNYDFVHCKGIYAHWRLAKKRVFIPKMAYASLLQRELFYTGSLYPVCSIFRARKFLKRDWIISAGQLLKIAMQISHLNLLDRETLREQLIGVDISFFLELISRLDQVAESDDEGVDGALTYELVVDFIDDIWGTL